MRRMLPILISSLALPSVTAVNALAASRTITDVAKPQSANYPEDRRYNQDHLWVMPQDDGTFLVGVSSFGMQEMGDLYSVSQEYEGQSLEIGETFSSIESVKAVLDLYMPISGTVSQINPSLVLNPTLMNLDPYGTGWLAVIEPANPEEFDALMEAAAYRDYTLQ